MKVNTLIIGYTPTVKNLKANQYFDDLIKEFNLGDIYFADYNNYKESMDEVKPIIVITFSNVTAQEIKDYKKDNFLYLIDHPITVLRKKKEEEQKNTFKEIEGLIAMMADKNEEEEKAIRGVAGMNYKDTYEMIKEMLRSGKDELVQKAWEMLQQNHGEWPWMRAQLMIETWKSASAKRKEELLLLTADECISDGIAKRGEDVKDDNGNKYRQYIFLDKKGEMTGEVFFIPRATDKMDGSHYEVLAEKCAIRNPLTAQLIVKSRLREKLKDKKIDSVKVKKSKIQGQGVFANRDFKKGEIVLRWNPKVLTKKQANKLSEDEKNYLVIEGGRYLFMQEPERYVNHSCDFNTFPKNKCDVAIRDIKKGEEITSDYSQIESLDNFECKCGAKNCKK